MTATSQCPLVSRIRSEGLDTNTRWRENIGEEPSHISTTHGTTSAEPHVENVKDVISPSDDVSCPSDDDPFHVYHVNHVPAADGNGEEGDLSPSKSCEHAWIISGSRSNEGLAAARARGHWLGRPTGSLGPSTLDGIAGEIPMLMASGSPRRRSPRSCRSPRARCTRSSNGAASNPGHVGRQERCSGTERGGTLIPSMSRPFPDSVGFSVPVRPRLADKE
jgi:hypothetical protein